MSQCINCGEIGHNQKQCELPTQSYGIIARATVGSEKKYLLIQRRHSIQYIIFVRGSYTLKDIQALNLIFRRMTKEEKQNLLDNINNFENIWQSIWQGYDFSQLGPIYHANKEREKKMSNEKFLQLTKGIQMKNGRTLTLEGLIKSSNTDACLEWGFPKGRRNASEDKFDCAAREFEEESGLSRTNLKLSAEFPHQMIEEFLGTDRIAYRYIYFVCDYLLPPETNLMPHGKIANEVSKIKWCSFEEACENLTKSNKWKLSIIKKLHNL